MENASKALIMAGAILFTIMVAGLLVYFMSQYRQFPQQQTEQQRLEQVAKFNREYESYDKKKMYGTDVATIVNKAIDNNKKYADERTGQYVIDDTNNHYINVEIKLLTDIQMYATQYYEVEQVGEDLDSYVESQNFYEGKITGYINGNKNKKETYNLDAYSFSANTTISLLEEDVRNKVMISNSNLEDFFGDPETVRIMLISGPKNAKPATKFDSRNYTEVYSGFTDFKRSFFECTGLEYDEETSMVDCIKFKEIPREDEEV